MQMMTEEQKPESFGRFHRNFMRFSLIGLTFAVLLLAFLVASLVDRIENMMPAEVQFILQLMKNRFFR